MAITPDFFSMDNGDAATAADNTYRGDGLATAPDLFEGGDEEAASSQASEGSADSTQTINATEEIKDNVSSEDVSNETTDRENQAASNPGSEDDQAANPELQRAVEKEIKRLVASYQDSNIEVPADAVFKHKVDKEEVEVSLQDLLNNFSGKQSWEKKFSELDQERKTYKQDLDVVNRYINEFAEVSKKDKIAGLEKLAEAVGLNPLEYRRQLRNEMVNAFGSYLQMDEQEREQFDLKEELAFMKRQQEIQSQRAQEQQAQRELQLKYNELEQTHGIDSNRRDELLSELKQLGHEQVTPELLAQAHVAFKNQDRTIATLKDINPDFAVDENKQTVLMSLLQGNPEMSDKELKEYANKLWGNDVSKAIENLQKKAAPSNPPQPKMTFKPKQNAPGRVDFFND